MKKNDIVELNITDVTLQGSGVGHYEGIAVFVPETVTGDVIEAHILKVKSNCAFAKVHKILLPSSKRIADGCESFKKCGGCAFRHIDYAFESELKANAVCNNLKRIGGVEPEMEPIITLSPDGYRNKCQYPVAKTESGIDIGFFAPHSHRVVDCPKCELQPECFSKAVKIFKKFLIENNIEIYDEAANKGVVRHLYLRRANVTGEVMACVVINSDEMPFSAKLVECFKEAFGDDLKSVVVNINKKKTNVILGEKCVTVYGSDHITDVLCGVKIRISPLSFYQVNHDVAELLYKKAAEYAEPEGKTVLDLYCGAGTIGLSMASKAKRIIGVEIIEQAVEDAKFNAKANGFTNTEFLCDDAAGAAKVLSEKGIKPDVIILDPPRKGCDESLIETVATAFSPERVVYVSCDSATLSRDCKIFKTLGYETVKAIPVDMFPRTGHVETVALISKEKSYD